MLADATGLSVGIKSARFANYMATLQSEIPDLTHACGLPHPALVTLDHFDVLDDNFSAHSARDIFGYEPSWGLPPLHEQDRIWQEAGHTTGLAERSAAE